MLALDKTETSNINIEKNEEIIEEVLEEKTSRRDTKMHLEIINELLSK